MNLLDRDIIGWSVHRRLLMVLALMLLVMVALMLRSWYLQVLKHDKYSTLAKNNRGRLVAEKPERGLIFDRRGRALVTNTPTYDLALVLDDVVHLADTVTQVARVLNVDPAPMLKAAKRQRRTVPYLPVIVHEDLTLAQVGDVEWARIAGVRVLGETRRHFTYGKSAAHLLGYVGEISEKQLGNLDFGDVLPGTRVGQYGAESVFDAALRGEVGHRRIEVDAKGFEVREISRNPPRIGDDVYLTLDINLQQVAEQALAGRNGTVIALDPNSGQVLALASFPSFDPEEMSRGISNERWQEIRTDSGRPLLNRAVQGVYPPGSIFKLPVAAAILEEHKNRKRFFCPGKYPFGGRDYRDWKKGGHGWVDMKQAIVQSCDVYFYDYGHTLGIDTIAAYAGKFGFGEPTGINLPAERRGILPSSAWKKLAKKEVWYPGETLSAAIGQGFVSTTPIQIAAFMAAVGVQGERYQPNIQLGIWHHKQDALVLAEAVALERAALSGRTYATLRDALVGVVSGSKGTGKAARSKRTTIAGKTGTAQVVAIAEDAAEHKKKETIPVHLRDHAWFAAFAPADKPEIAVAVLVEHGGHGGSVAGPVARKVIDAYLSQAGRNLSPEALTARLTLTREARALR